MPDTLTISREDLVYVASDAEAIFRVFTVLTGRAENDLCDRLADLVERINDLGADADNISDEVRLFAVPRGRSSGSRSLRRMSGSGSGGIRTNSAAPSRASR